ncbi:unnamed protein product [Candida verbasci]|uniref:HotDog ACOT-type domain-containing protein n=1 Tax=Candida verbasci TaxID=1227364 RepID=A0A9W4U082_9ASCO|nr:unnamed protein product [Candida verbasci]
MIKIIRSSNIRHFKQFKPIIRFNSQASANFHKPDKAGSNQPAEAADAAATILADLRDKQINPNKSTWIDALKEQERLIKEGKTIDSFNYVDPVTTEVGEKTRSDSFTFLELPFKKDKWLCDAYINAFGRLRAGQLFQDLDALAGRIAYRHCSPAEPVNVTASVDRIYMVKKVDEIEKYNFILAGAVSWTGRSSMEIDVKGYAFDNENDYDPENITEDSLPEQNVFLTANFTFVARNPITHKSFAINRLLPITEIDWINYRRAESHNAKKKLLAKNKKIMEPTSEESKLIYEMWKSSKTILSGENDQNKNVEGFQFMKNTMQKSTLFMQPQYRNRHSYMIFGGYLLRQSFELAYCTAASFSSAGPRFVSLDSTTFKNPVPVGSVLSMNSSISYTEHLHDSNENHDADSPFDFRLPATNKISGNPDAFLSEPGTLIQVKVDTFIQHLESSQKKPAGTFIYSFFVPRDSYGSNRPGYCSVIPQTYSEMMTYIGGRRRAQDTALYVETLPKIKS